MTAVHALPDDVARAPAPGRAHRLALLDDPREGWRRCQVRPRVELFEACAMLCTDRARSRATFREALLRTLTEALGRRPVFYRAGSTDISFDEAWLMAVVEAIDRADSSSLAFLTGSRLRSHTRRNIAFLVNGSISDGGAQGASAS